MSNGSGFGRPFLYVLPTVLLFGHGSPRAAQAQDEAPKYELFAGYAFLRDLEIESNFPLGWDVSLGRNLSKSFGVVADFGGNYKSEGGVDLNVHAFLGGMRYSFRGERVTPYVEALAGVARTGASAAGVSGSSSDFAVQGGLGLGLKVKENVWLRTGADYRNVFSGGGSAQEYRLLAGVSFGFGGSREAPAPAAPPPARTPVREPSPQGALPPVTAPPPMPRIPPAEAPAPQAPRPSPPAAPALGPLAQGQESLRAGSYSEAAEAFRGYLGAYASYQFTIPVGVYCESSNVAQQVRSSGGSQELFLLRLRQRGQLCYGLYWGLFGSRAEAEAGLDRLPPALRTPGQAPISVSRVLSRSR